LVSFISQDIRKAYELKAAETLLLPDILLQNITVCWPSMPFALGLFLRGDEISTFYTPSGERIVFY